MAREDYQEVYTSPLDMEETEVCGSPSYASYYFRPHYHNTGGSAPNHDPTYSPGPYEKTHYQNGMARRPKVPRPSKVRRYLLTRDPRDRRISGNGLGMKVVGGKEISGTRGRLGAYIARIQAGGVADSLGQLKEGDLLLEWNGISLVDRTYEEVQSIVTQSGDDAEVEIVVRSDINMITGKRMARTASEDPPPEEHRRYSDDYDIRYQAQRLMHQRKSDSSVHGTCDPLDINGNQSTGQGNSAGDQEVCVPERRRSASSSRRSSPRFRSTSRTRYTSPELQGLELGANDTRSLNGDEGSRVVSTALRNSPMHRQALHDRPASADCIKSMSCLNYRPQPIGASHQSSQRTLISKSSSPVDRDINRDSIVRSSALRDSKGIATSADGAMWKTQGTVTSWKSQDDRLGFSNSLPPQGRPPPKPSRAKHMWNTHSKGSQDVATQQSLGEVQLQVCYDSQAWILYVTVLRARSLFTVKENGLTSPDPFVKVHLLPGRSVENERRTRFFSVSSSPEWNQTMVYPKIAPEDLPKRRLEVSAWHYMLDKPNEFLGEVVLDLSDAVVLDEQARWYRLHEVVRADLAD